MRQQRGGIWAVAVGIALLATPLARADGGACFFIDESGQQVDLGSLCGGSPGKGSQRDDFTARIKRRQAGIPVIDVTFNGRYTFEMLLDTGATVVVIPTYIARQLEFRPEGTAPFETANGRVNTDIGRVRSVSVAGIVARDLVVAVGPTLDLGLLGQNFYGDYDVTIRQDVVEFRRRR